MITPQFSQITLEGADAQSFLQSQLTCNVSKLGLSYQTTAIANLKGRIEFGIWIKKQGEQQFDIAISSDCMPALQAHLKKYGAFSKFTTSEPTTIYPCAIDDEPTFSHNESHHDVEAWIARSLATGNYWITAATQGLFQPQELRLHQRAGVDYDKGCYLGQEVIARIYFKASPKAYLHRILGQGEVPTAGGSLGKAQVVNAHITQTALDNQADFEALVCVRPEQLAESGLIELALPAALQASVAREI